MILGIGVDLAQISRMAQLLKNRAFAERCFTAGERDYLKNKNAAADQSAAGLFAAKEAFLKAIGTGLSGASFQQIEILHDATGAPRLRLSGKALERAQALGASRWLLSLSHDGDMAVALVVLEGESPLAPESSTE